MDMRWTAMGSDGGMHWACTGLRWASLRFSGQRWAAPRQVALDSARQRWARSGGALFHTNMAAIAASLGSCGGGSVPETGGPRMARRQEDPTGEPMPVVDCGWPARLAVPDGRRRKVGAIGVSAGVGSSFGWSTLPFFVGLPTTLAFTP